MSERKTTRQLINEHIRKISEARDHITECLVCRFLQHNPNTPIEDITLVSGWHRSGAMQVRVEVLPEWEKKMRKPGYKIIAPPEFLSEIQCPCCHEPAKLYYWNETEIYVCKCGGKGSDE